MADGGRMPEGEILRAKSRGGRNGVEKVYTPELAAEICWRLASGESLINICKDERMPSDTTVRFWAIQDLNGFALEYATAREALMERWADDIVTIADDETLDPNVRRVKCDNRRWLMSKLASRRYGDKLVHSGDPANPIQVMHHRAGISDMGSTELAALAQLA